MKRKNLIIILGLLVGFPSFVNSQPINPLEIIFERLGPRINPSDLRVLQLDIFPDPVAEGQRIRFEATISSLSHYSARLSLFVKDRDEVVTSVQDVLIQPGHNRVIFPQTGYRFSRHEHCFTVEVDIERTHRAIDVVKEFCVRRTYAGWSLKEIRIGPLFIEDLDMIPDPAMPGQEIRFRVRVRNDGSPFRGSIRIQDRDQAVVSLNDVTISSGYTEYYFPYTHYAFQRFDHCFTVIVDVERTPHRVDAAREFCAKPMGWTLNP